MFEYKLSVSSGCETSMTTTQEGVELLTVIHSFPKLSQGNWQKRILLAALCKQVSLLHVQWVLDHLNHKNKTLSVS